MSDRKPEWIIDAFFDAVVAADEDRPPDIGWHHPSGMATPCLRRLQWQFIGMPVDNPVSPQVRVMGQIGNKLHELGEGVSVHPDVRAVELNLEEPSIPIRGRTDVFVNDYDDQPAIVDWKGCVSLPDAPKEPHVLQAAWYAYMAQVSRVVLVYIHRGYAAARRFTLEWSEMDAIWTASKEQAELVTRMTLDGELAPRTPRSRAKDCKGCPFLGTCDRTQLDLEDSWILLVKLTQQKLSGRLPG